MAGDIFDRKKRSYIMSRIRGKNTKVELLVYRYLKQQKIYFQKHYRTKQGIRVDLALPRKKKAVFIDGDFWHGRTLERVRERRGNTDFWTKKLERNIGRDKEQLVLLKDAGWQVLRIWESELTKKATQDTALESVKAFLASSD